MQQIDQGQGGGAKSTSHGLGCAMNFQGFKGSRCSSWNILYIYLFIYIYIYIYELHVSKEVKSVMWGLSENGYPKISWLIIIFSVLAILGYPRLFDKPVCFQCIRQLFVHDSCWRAKKRMAKSLAFMATDCFDRPACKLMGMLRIALG